MGRDNLLELIDKMGSCESVACKKGFERRTLEEMEGLGIRITGMKDLINTEENKGEFEKWLSEEVNKILACCRSGDERLVKRGACGF